jgi:hypothetical protein
MKLSLLGAEHQRDFDDIKKYLSSPPVIKAPRTRILFRLYIAVEDGVIGVVMTQVTDVKEHIITYLSWRLIDAKTRYSFIEKLCLPLFYACFKLRHYLLSSICVVAYKADVFKHMLHQLILSGRIGK